MASQADIAATLEILQDHIAPGAAPHIVNLWSSSLADVSPELLPQVVAARLQAPGNEHFRRQQGPRPGSVEAIRAEMDRQRIRPAFGFGKVSDPK